MKPAKRGDPDPATRTRRRKRKRKNKGRQTPSKEESEEKEILSQEQSSDEIGPVKKRKRKQDPLKGMIIAVSTLDVRGKSHTDSESSYKAIADLCQSLGASVTGQLHRRVSCLVCNPTAVNNATQRVRKAVKKNVPLVDVEWIRQCREQEKCVDLEPFRLDNVAVQVIESRPVESSDAVYTTPNEDELPASVWSEPASLGCCCVCHENGDANCPWCTGCYAKI